MFCSRCGTEVQVSSKFCPTCGLDLTTITQGMTAAQPAAQAGQPVQPDEAAIVRDALKDEYEIEKELGQQNVFLFGSDKNRLWAYQQFVSYITLC